MKKSFLILTTILLILGINLGILSACYAKKSEMIFLSNGDGTCVINGFKGDATTVYKAVIPAKSPDGERVIGIKNFNLRFIKSVVLPDTVTYIGDEAFKGCYALSKIILPNGLKSIGNYAFYQNFNLENITLPDSLEYIGYDAFYGCKKLNAVLYDNAFYIGNNLNPYMVLLRAKNDISYLYVHKDTKSITTDAFKECSNLKFNRLDGGLYLGSLNNPYMALYGYEDASFIAVNENTAFILSNAFNGLNKLEKLSLPKCITEIGDCAFLNCYNLKQIEYGGSKSDWQNIIRQETCLSALVKIHYNISSNQKTDEFVSSVF